MGLGRGFIIVCFLALLTISIASAQSRPIFREVAQFGRGDIQTIEWHPSGNKVLVSTVLGVWIHSADFTSEVFLPEARLAAFSPDGHFIAGVDFSNTVRIWDAETLQPFGEMDFLLLRVRDIVWHPDSRYLAVAGLSTSYEHVLIWDTHNAEIHSLRGNGEHFDKLVWSPEGHYLGSLNFDNGAIAAWTLAEGRIFNEPAAEDKGGLKIAWRREGELMRATQNEHMGVNIELWNVQTGVLLVSDDFGSAIDVAYSPDGSFFTIGVFDYLAILPWTLGPELRSLSLNTDFPTIAWSPDSAQFAAGAYNFSPEKMATVWIIDPKTGQTIQEYAPHRQTVERMVWNSDGSRLLSVGVANDVAIYDLQRNEVISRLNAYTTINGIAAWNDDNTLLAAADTLENVHVWDTVTGQMVAEYGGHRQMVTEIDWQPNGSLLAARGGDNHNSVNADIHIWDVAHPAQGAPAYVFTHDVTGISAMDWNPNGQILTSVELSGQIHFWDIDDPQESYKRLVNQYASLHDVDWNPTGDRIAILIASTTSSIFVYDVLQDHFSSLEIYDDEQTEFTWTPDNDLRLLESWPGFVVTWPIIREFSQPETITYLKGMVNPINQSYVTTNLRLSPSGRMAAAFDEQHNGLVWNVESGQALFMLSSTEDIFWSPDETMLAVERSDQSIWLLDANGRVLQQLSNRSIRAHYSHVYPAILWSPDSQRFAHIADGVITVWVLVE